MDEKDLASYTMLNSDSVYVQEAAEVAVITLLRVLTSPSQVDQRTRAALARTRDVLDSHAIRVLQKLAAADGVQLEHAAGAAGAVH